MPIKFLRNSVNLWKKIKNYDITYNRVCIFKNGGTKMGRVKSEYEVESLFIDRLQEMGYEFIPMKTYDDLIENFKKQICELNRENLIEAKGIPELSDSEFDRIMLISSQANL